MSDGDDRRTERGRRRGSRLLAAVSVLAGALVVLAPTTGAVASGCPSVGSGAGVLDVNFGGCGIATAQPGTASAGYPGVVHAVTTESVNGSTDVVIAGQYQHGSGSGQHPLGLSDQMALSRFGSSGSPDGAWPNNGTALPLATVSSSSAAEGVVSDGASGVAAAGEAVLSGGVETPVVVVVSGQNGSWTPVGRTYEAVAPGNASFAVGSSFEAIGVIPSTASEAPNDLIAAGTIATAAEPGGELLVAAFTPSGTLDVTNFCPSGCNGAPSGEWLPPFTGIANFGGQVVSPGAVAIDPAGNIFVTGSTPMSECGSVYPIESFVVALHGNGTLNPAFNAGGTPGYEFISAKTATGGCTDSLAAQSVTVVGGSWPYLVLGGQRMTNSTSAASPSGSGNGFLLGLSSGGVAAGSFGAAGAVVAGTTTTTGLELTGSGLASNINVVNALATLYTPSGSSVEGLVATGTVSGGGSIGLSLFDQAGNAASYIGGTGTSTAIDCPPAALGSCGQGLAIQPDGNFLVAGGVSGQSNTNPAVVQDDLSVARLVEQSIEIDAPTPTVSVSAPTSVSFTVTFFGAANGLATVGYSTVDGSATNGTNYSGTSGTIIFPCTSNEPSGVSCAGGSGGPRSDEAVVSVPVLDNGSSSGDLSFSMQLSNPVNAGLAVSSATVTLNYGLPAPAPTTTTTATATTTTVATPPPTLPKTVPKKVKVPAAGKGYWLLLAAGTVRAFGDAPRDGSPTAKELAHRPAVAIAALPNGTGYWIATDRGLVVALGAAKGHGSVKSKALVGTIRAMAAQTSGSGYWLASTTGAVYAFGGARNYGSIVKGKASGTITSISRTSNGKGYWLSSTTGALYRFGDAAFFGQLLGKAHAGSVIAFAALPNSTGYWQVTSGGTVYAFGRARSYGSVTAKMALHGAIVAMTPTPDDKGYWLASSTGQVFAFGSARSYGSMATKTLVGMATT